MIAVVALPVWRPLDRGLQAPVLVVGTAPSGITGALRGILQPGDRILAPQPWGSWLEFAFPQATVAVDSRIELFPASVWAGIDRIDGGTPGWQTTLDSWRVRIAIAPAADAELAERLMATGWRVVFRDDDGSVVVRGD